jgi:serine/threonine protein kinase
MSKVGTSLLKKLKHLTEIRQEIKKKRLVLDEGKEKFGMNEMSQLIKVKNTSEVKGYPLKLTPKNTTDTKGMSIVGKVVPMETKYDKEQHPSHLESIILKHLTDKIVLKQISPHITYYLGNQKVSNKSRALKQLNLKKLEVEGKIRSYSTMLLSEFVDGGSLDNWVFETYENDKEITDEQWRCLVFQLIYTIAILQHYFRMMHNDFHYGNILIDTSVKPEGYLVYEINGQTYYLKNTGVIPKLWDFEFSMVYSNKMPDAYHNKFITGSFHYDTKNHKTIVEDDQEEEDFNVPYNFNQVYDLHYFLTSLLDLYISQDLFDWIMGLYPDEVIPEDDVSTATKTTPSQDTESTPNIRSTQGTKSTRDTQSTLDTLSTLSTDDTESSDEDTEASEDTAASSDDTKTAASDDTQTSSEDTDAASDLYLQDGRLINGIEKQFDLPSPLEALSSKFFNCFTTKPDDFDESKALFFKAGF